MEDKIQQMIKILEGHGAKKIKIFGSYARGEALENSDLDIIVDFYERKSILQLVGHGAGVRGKLGVI